MLICACFKLHWKPLLTVTILSLIACVSLSHASSTPQVSENHSKNNGTHKSDSSHHGSNIEVAGWHFDKLSAHITICCFIMIVCIMKIGYHKMPAKCRFITASIPESNMLIIVGILFGILVFFISGHDYKLANWSLHPDLFFFILLPPIMLESAYSLYDRDFLNNLSTILYFAVIGTVLNCLIIGFSLYGISLTPAMGPKLNLTVILVFFLDPL